MLKKYPNRRLYDTEKARYMTLEGIRQRVMEGESVMMHNSHCDITASILVTLMASDIENGRVAPTADQLRAFIQSYQPKPTGAK